MNKQELEQALVDPESLKALTDRARQIKEKYGTLAIGIDQPSIRVQRIEPDADEIRPTREEIERTKQDHLETRTLLPEMLHRIPEL